MPEPLLLTVVCGKFWQPLIKIVNLIFVTTLNSLLVTFAAILTSTVQ